MRDQIEALHRRGLRGMGISIGHLDSGVAARHSPAAFALVERGGFGLAGHDPGDSTGHGTRTASLLTGPLGVAPGARLLAAAAIEQGNVVARLAVGLDWLISRDVRVVVMPVGLRTPSPALSGLIEVCARRDILVVCPIGNGGAGAGLFPASCPSVLSVGACDAAGRVLRQSASLMSRTEPERCIAPLILAPGWEVPVSGRSGRHDLMTGTSPAAALVGGVAALIRAARLDASAGQVVAALQGTARPVADPESHRAVAGIIRPADALDLIDRVDEQPAPPSGPDTRIEARARLTDRLSRLAPDAQVDVIAWCWDHLPSLPATARRHWLSALPIVVLQLVAGEVAAIFEIDGVRSVELADTSKGIHTAAAAPGTDKKFSRDSARCSFPGI